MSQPVTDAKAFYEAGREGRFQDIPALLHSDFEFHPMAGFPHGRPYRGWAAVATEFFPALASEFESWAAIPSDIVAADGRRVLVMGHYHAGIKGTTEIATIPFVHVWETREGRLLTAYSYTDTLLVQAAAARGRG